MALRSSIRVFGASQHNLKGINVEIPWGVVTVITGPSGSGKSSLAFDTLYAEGHRKYVESLSAYARQFLEQLPKPDVDRIEGLTPTIAIEQRVANSSPRSTVATITDIHDFLRVLFARTGQPVCWKCQRSIECQSIDEVVDTVLSEPARQRLMVLAPVINHQRGAHRELLERMLKEGFVRVRVDGEISLIEELEPLPPNRHHTIEVVVDRLTVKPEIASRLADSAEIAAGLSGGRVIIATEDDSSQWIDQRFSSTLSCPVHPEVRIESLSPQLLSFNTPQGACQQCNGLGTTLEFDMELVVPDRGLSLADGAIAAWRRQGPHLSATYTTLIQEFCENFDVLPDMPFNTIAEQPARILISGTNKADAARFDASFEGVLPNLRRRWETTESESAKQKLHAFQSETPCQSCNGSRLNVAARSLKIDGKSVADFAKMTVAQAREFFSQFSIEGEAAIIAKPIIEEILRRLEFLSDVGVDYLTLDRSASSLSGGEWQRIRLATQIGSGLAGVCYVLDEPTVGLHPRDTQRLSAILSRLAGMGNTVVVVEHDEEIIRSARYVIDIGPGAGAHGGLLMAQGTLEEVLTCERSTTANFLTGRTSIPIPDKRREVDWNSAIELCGVTANNLKNIKVRFPLGCLVCVTGVSGSGKSSLVTQVLTRALKRRIDQSGPKPGPFESLAYNAEIEKVIEIDQSSIGKTPRSNPATYVGVFDLIRQLYAKTREAKIRGYTPARFSFNIKGGRCDACEGQGTKRIAMHFLPDVFVTCAACSGRRYNRETLDVRYRGKTVADILEMRVEEAVEFFDSFANIRQRLKALQDVGLGYMTLGQPSNTLSGGEAQRVKLASQLHRSTQGHTIYVLDEPTTGLHFEDVGNLLTILTRLVDRGQTVLVIEHNLDVIKTADWVIDLGPEGGDAGGSIVAEGTPEQIAQCEQSYTGQFLKNRLEAVDHCSASRPNEDQPLE